MSSSAAELTLPAWAVVQPKRRAHIARVMALIGEWADAKGVGPEMKRRWQEAARLHEREDLVGRILGAIAPPGVKIWETTACETPVNAAGKGVRSIYHRRRDE